MNWMYNWLRSYFGFSKMESNGFVILIPLMFIIIISPYVYRHHLAERQISWDTAVMDSLTSRLDSAIKMKSFEYQKKINKSRQRVYADNRKSYPQKEYEKFKEQVAKEKPRRIALKPFDINTADTAALKKIYGVGAVLSARIVKYRDLLGGFTSKDQLSEVYGLDTEVVDRLDSMTYISDDFVPKQLSVNELKAYELDDHPYLSKKIARAIDAYRHQHGKFESLESLYNLHLIDSTHLQRVAPYLKL